MKFKLLSAAALLAGGLALTACGPSVGYTTSDGGHGNVACPGLPLGTNAPSTPVNGSCTWDYTPPAAPTTTTTPVTTTPPTTTPPTTTTPPPVTGTQYPSPANTGVPAGTALTVVQGNVTATSGQTFRNVHVTGSIYVASGPVTIVNSQVDGGINNISHPTASFTVTDTTIGPATGCHDSAPEAGLEAGNFTATRVLIRNHNHDVQPEAANAVVQDSFMSVCSLGSDHADGVIAYNSGLGLRIVHNTIDMSHVPAANQTAPLFDTGTVPDFYAENNLILGGSYSIRIYDDRPAGGTGPLVVKNNHVVNNSWLYGAVNSSCGSVAWSGNDIVEANSAYQVTKVVGPLACK